MSNRYPEEHDRKGSSHSKSSRRRSKSPRSRTRSRSRSWSPSNEQQLSNDKDRRACSKSDKDNSPASYNNFDKDNTKWNAKDYDKYNRGSSSSSQRRDGGHDEKRYSRDYNKKYGSYSSSDDDDGSTDDDDTNDDDKQENTSIKKYSFTNKKEIMKAPPAPRISKVAIEFGKPGSIPKTGIQMKLNPPADKAAEQKKKITVASAFNNDSDDEVEEMPAECRMRMRNIGRDTPTSSGPNSFGKTKQGFCDAKKIFEKNLRNVIGDDS